MLRMRIMSVVPTCLTMITAVMLVSGTAQASKPAGQVNPEVSWCGNACKGADPYVPLPASGPFHGVVCATGAHQVRSSAHPKSEKDKPPLVDTKFTVSQWYSPRCQTTWAKAYNAKATGRRACIISDYGVPSGGGSPHEDRDCPAQGKTQHTAMVNDHNVKNVAGVSFYLVVQGSLHPFDRWYHARTTSY